ncbi:MAG: ABC transporter ATP-binding protein/permease [Oscillospiraceae bacterium]|nr:ABC transporter ATP-binding protein/permease [Oscillospiraceae bacterium]
MSGRLLYIGSVFFMAASILATYAVPQIIRFVVDNLVGGLPLTSNVFVAALVERAGGVEYLRANILSVGAFTLLVAGAGGLCNFIRGRFLILGSEGFIRRLRERLYSHIQKLPYAWHVNVQAGDIIQRCTSDVEVVRNFIASQLIEMARTLLLFVFAYIILFSMNVPMAMASFVFLPVIIGYSFFFLRGVGSRFLAADEAEGQLLSVAQENLTGVRVVRAFGRERYEIDRFERENNNFANLWVRLGSLLSWYWGTSDMITALQMIITCVVGVYQAVAGSLTVGEFIVFLSYNSMIIWPARGLGRVLSEASKTSVSLGRIKEILDAPDELDLPGAFEMPVDGDIVYDGVTFSYGNKKVLDNVSFTVEKGTTLGILGGTGSGKTTVAHLLCRLYDLEPGNGSISIGGADITEFKRAWLRRNIGIALQEPFLYSRTIKENIASLMPRYTIDDIRKAAGISCIGDAVEAFANGYDTVVGERGVTLSGGQKQRVAIARAILGNPPIMVFDDSLSAVDTETDAKIRAALNERTSGSTVIIISHRITSLLKADKIIVLEDGRVIETGSHPELLEQGGVYSRVYGLQSSIEEADA